MMTICSSRAHCVPCRTNAGFRAALVRGGVALAAEFECPFGVTESTAREQKPQPVPPRPVKTAEELAREKAAQGRAAWSWLHAEAAAGRLTEALISGEFLPMIPSFGCSCLPDTIALLKTLPFRPTDQFAWSVDFHNAINAKLAAKGDTTKRQWTVAEARAAMTDAITGLTV